MNKGKAQRTEEVRQQLERLADDMQRQYDHRPLTYEELTTQRIRVNVLVKFALQLVSDVLPEDMQSTIQHMLSLHDATWSRMTEKPSDQQETP